MHAKVLEVLDWDAKSRIGEDLEKQLNDFLTEEKEISVRSFVMSSVVLPQTEARGFSQGAGVIGACTRHSSTNRSEASLSPSGPRPGRDSASAAGQ